MKKKYVDWWEVEAYVQGVCQYAEDNKLKLSGVYGLPRGGLVLAVMLSHRLNIPLLMSPTNDCLIVDDISDSGESLIHYCNNSSGIDTYYYTITTMFWNEDSTVAPDYYWDVKREDWIVFPWEVN